MRACHRAWADDAMRQVNSFDVTLTNTAVNANLIHVFKLDRQWFRCLKELRVTLDPPALDQTGRRFSRRIKHLKTLRSFLCDYGHVRVEALGEWPHSLRLIGRCYTPPDAINLDAAVQDNRNRASGALGQEAAIELTEGEALFLAEFPFVWLPQDRSQCVLTSTNFRFRLDLEFEYDGEFVRRLRDRFPDV